MKVAIGRGLGYLSLLMKGIRPDIVISPSNTTINDTTYAVFPEGTEGDELGGLNVWGGAMGWPLSVSDEEYFSHYRMLLFGLGFSELEVDDYLKKFKEHTTEEMSLIPFISTKEFKAKLAELEDGIKHIDGVVTGISRASDGVNLKISVGGAIQKINAAELFLCLGNEQTRNLLLNSDLRDTLAQDSISDTRIGFLGSIQLESCVENSRLNNFFLQSVRHRRVFRNSDGNIAIYLIPALSDFDFRDVIALKKLASGNLSFLKCVLREPIKFIRILYQYVVSELFVRRSSKFYIWCNVRPSVQFDDLKKYIRSIHEVEGSRVVSTNLLEDEKINLDSAFHLRGCAAGDLYADDKVFRLKEDPRIVVNSMASVTDSTCRNPGVFLF